MRYNSPIPEPVLILSLLQHTHPGGAVAANFWMAKSLNADARRNEHRAYHVVVN